MLTQLIFVSSVNAGELMAIQNSELPSAQVQARKQALSDIDRIILTEYIKLARFNTNFHMNANRHQWWRMYTYPISREIGGAANFANTVTDLGQQARGLNDPAKISTKYLKAGLVSAVAGSAISGSSSALELGQNFWVMHNARRLGYGPSASVMFAREWMKTTDTLLLRRREIVASNISSQNRKTRDIEGILLVQMRNQLLFEFRKWSVRSRETAWRENTFYAIDALQSYTTCAASIASLVAYQSPQIRGGIAITNIVANSAAMLNPTLSNMAGVLMRKHQRKKLSQYFPDDRPVMEESVSSDLAKLQQQAAEDPIAQHSLREAVFLNNRSGEMDEKLTAETDRIEKLRKIAQQKTYSGTLIGLSGLSRSIISLKVFYTENSFDRAKLSFAGRISQASGQVYVLVDTPTTLVKSIINQHRLEAQGKLPSQVFARRLADLDVLEKQVQSQHPFGTAP